MEEEDLDERSCPGGIAKAAPRSPPEPLVGLRERTRRAGLGERDGARERAGLAGEQLKIVVEDEELAALAQAPLVAGDELLPVEDRDRPGAATDVDPPAGEAHRDRVARASHPDPGLAIDERPERDRGVERLRRQWPQMRQLGLGHRADRREAALDMARFVGRIRPCEQLVEPGEIRDPWHRHEVPAAEAADLAFDAALLVGARLTGLAEERVEAIVGSEGDEAVGLDPVPPLQHPGDGRAQVVVADPPGHAPEALERFDMALEERLLAVRAERDVDRAGRVAQAEVEDLDLHRRPGDDHRRLAEVDLGLVTRWMDLGHGDERRT